MKHLVILLLILSSLTVSSQSIYKMRMQVQEIESYGKFCTDDTTVFWGIKQDTVCFSFTGKTRCYYPFTQDSIGQAKFKQYMNLSLKRHLSPESTDYLLMDKFKEVYHIRFISNFKEAEMIIFIVNLDFGTPSYTLTWRPQFECDP